MPCQEILCKNRAVEIDRFIQKIYEDNVNGRISDERFAMSMAFEEEQRQIKSAIPNMEQASASILNEYKAEALCLSPLICETRQHLQGLSDYCKKILPLFR